MSIRLFSFSTFSNNIKVHFASIFEKKSLRNILSDYYLLVLLDNNYCFSYTFVMEIFRFLHEKNGVLYDGLAEEKLDSEYKVASEKEKYDYYIKKSFINGSPYLPKMTIENGIDDFGFYIKRFDRIYDRYLAEKIKLEDSLSFDIRKSYDNSKGNEFKTGKYYSVASSSRFATSCFSENINGKIFLLNGINYNNNLTRCDISLEKNLDIFSKTGSLIANPQLDVAIDLSSGDIFFIEVKCHEIFDDHKYIKLKWKYMDSEFINSFIKKDIHLSCKKEKKEKYIALDNRFLLAQDFDCELETYHFDFKQFLCHLMGLLTYQKEHDVKIHFYYLFYKNHNYENEEKSDIYIQLEREMAIIFNVFGKKYPEIDFGYFYNDKFDTLKDKRIENELKLP